MGRLAEKSILLVIPKDYYDETELDPVLEVFKREEPRFLKVASPKFKEAVGMKNGRIQPDMLLVDAMEGITGDSYVTSMKGTRQVIAEFHAVVIIGGKGAKKYLWDDKILRILINDRFRAGAVIGAIGLAVPCLGRAGILDTVDVAVPPDAKALEEVETANALVAEENLVAADRIITARGGEAAEAFAEAVVEAVQTVSTTKK